MPSERCSTEFSRRHNKKMGSHTSSLSMDTRIPERLLFFSGVLIKTKEYMKRSWNWRVSDNEDEPSKIKGDFVVMHARMKRAARCELRHDTHTAIAWAASDKYLRWWPRTSWFYQPKPPYKRFKARHSGEASGDDKAADYLKLLAQRFWSFFSDIWKGRAQGYRCGRDDGCEVKESTLVKARVEGG